MYVPFCLRFRQGENGPRCCSLILLVIYRWLSMLGAKSSDDNKTSFSLPFMEYLRSEMLHICRLIFESWFWSPQIYLKLKIVKRTFPNVQKWLQALHFNHLNTWPFPWSNLEFLILYFELFQTIDKIEYIQSSSVYFQV